LTTVSSSPPRCRRHRSRRRTAFDVVAAANAAPLSLPPEPQPSHRCCHRTIAAAVDEEAVGAIATTIPS
jgi:hypothetical protein